MDKRTERALTEKVRRRLVHTLRPLGFTRTKSSIFTRPRPLWVEFIHLHKYSFTPGFRVHLGIRVLNAPSLDEGVALSGPDSHGEGWFELDFAPEPYSVERCVQEITDFCQQVGEPWFQRWSDSQALIWCEDDLLQAEDRLALDQASRGHPQQDRVFRSYRLLGIRVDA